MHLKQKYKNLLYKLGLIICVFGFIILLINLIQNNKLNFEILETFYTTNGTNGTTINIANNKKSITLNEIKPLQNTEIKPLQNTLLNSNILKLSSVAILGTGRNIEKYLPTTFEKIKMIRDCFTSSNIVIFENDSNDKTLEMLQNWAKDDPTIEIITEKNIQGLRTHRLAYGRNKILQKVLPLNTEYIVIIDLDEVNETLTRDAFLSSFSYPDNDSNYDWAVMTANQSRLYYDLWALRTFDEWMPFDCWGDCLYKLNKNVKWCVDDRYKNINENDKPILVKSAFGGLGIYKTKYLKNCSYDGGKDNYELCEHVKLHEDIIRNGGTIYINPKMINSIGK